VENLQFEFPAAAPASGRAIAGVVASGDLEVLLEPADAALTTVSIATSVSGMRPVWAAQLARIFGDGQLPAARLQINDFGATPGVVRMRIAQAYEDLAPAQPERNGNGR